jgi:DNA-binding response OmpR family regulator
MEFAESPVITVYLRRFGPTADEKLLFFCLVALIPWFRHKGQAVSQSILIVDDEREIREIQAEYLEAQGFDVVKASSGGEAISLLHYEADRFAVAIVDWQMAGIDGRAVIDLIRRKYPHVQVLISTGRSPEELSENTARRLGSSLLRKPFSLRSLGVEVQRLSATA